MSLHDKVLHKLTLLHPNFNFENLLPIFRADLTINGPKITGTVFAALFVSQHYEYC